MEDRSIPLQDRLQTVGYFNSRYYFQDVYFPDEWYYYDKNEVKFTRVTFDNFKTEKELFEL